MHLFQIQTFRALIYAMCAILLIKYDVFSFVKFLRRKVSNQVAMISYIQA